MIRRSASVSLGRLDGSIGTNQFLHSLDGLLLLHLERRDARRGRQVPVADEQPQQVQAPAAHCRLRVPARWIATLMRGDMRGGVQAERASAILPGCRLTQWLAVPLARNRASQAA